MVENQSNGDSQMSREEFQALCTTEVPTPSPELWQTVKADILRFEKEHWAEEGLEEAELQEMFEHPKSTIIFIKNPEGDLVGYTVAVPVQDAYSDDFCPEREKLPNAAYICNTVLDQRYTGRGLVGPLIARLEQELKIKGYQILERDSTVNFGYADKIRQNYGNQILKSEPHDSQFGPQVFFRIRL